MQNHGRRGAPPSSRSLPALEGVSAFLLEMLSEGLPKPPMDEKSEAIKGVIDTSEFFDLFPPLTIMTTLSRESLRRSLMLHELRYEDDFLADDLTPEEGGQVLAILVRLGKISPDEVLRTISSDKFVRLFDHRKIWSLIIARPFWLQRATEEERKQGKDSYLPRFQREAMYMWLLFKSATRHGLITADDIVKSLGLDYFWTRLFPGEQAALLKRIFQFGHEGRVFTEKDLIESVTLKSLVRRIPHRVLWQRVVNPMIEVAFDLGSLRPPESSLPGATDRPPVSLSDVSGLMDETTDSTYRFVRNH